MNGSSQIQNSGMQITWSADESAEITRRELTGYQALASGNFERARAFFSLSVALDPMSAFRVTQACVQAGAYGLAMMVSWAAASKVALAPGVGTPEQRLRIVVECFALSMVNLSTAQLLQMDISEWSWLPKRPCAFGSLSSDKIKLLDTGLSYLRESYEYSPIITLKLIFMLASLGVFREPRHRESLRSNLPVDRISEQKKICGKEDYKQIDELRRLILTSVFSEELAVDAEDILEGRENSLSKNEERAPLLAAFDVPKRKKWLKPRFPFQNQAP